MNSDRIIYITAYWNGEHVHEEFEDTCVVWGKDSKQDASESSSPLLADEEVFFYFQHDEAILGNHGDFTVTAYKEEDGYIPS
jgi:hypothetical protein